MYRRTDTCLSRYRNTVVAVGGDARVARRRLGSDTTGDGTVDERQAFFRKYIQKPFLCRNQRVQPLRLAIKIIGDGALSGKGRNDHILCICDFPIQPRYGRFICSFIQFKCMQQPIQPAKVVTARCVIDEKCRIGCETRIVTPIYFPIRTLPSNDDRRRFCVGFGKPAVWTIRSIDLKLAITPSVPR